MIVFFQVHICWFGVASSKCIFCSAVYNRRFKLLFKYSYNFKVNVLVNGVTWQNSQITCSSRCFQLPLLPQPSSSVLLHSYSVHHGDLWATPTPISPFWKCLPEDPAFGSKLQRHPQPQVSAHWRIIFIECMSRCTTEANTTVIQFPVMER